MKPNRRNPLFSNFFRGNTLAAAVVVSLTGFAASNSAQAANIYWDGTSTGWNAVANWSTGSGATTPDPSAVPGIADVAIFNTSILNSAQTVNLNAAQSALGLSFVTSGTVAIQGGGVANQTLTLAGSGIAKTGTGAITIGSVTANQGVSISLSASQTWSNSNNTGAIVVTNGVAPSAASNRTLTLGGTSTAANTILGVIANNGAGVTSLTKSDAGTWVLGQTTVGAVVNNTFTGNVTINGGTLRVEAPIANATPTNLGTGNTVAVNSGATLHLKTASTANVLTLANGIALSSGTIYFEDGNFTLSGAMSLAGSNTFNGRYNNKNLTISGVVSGVGGFTKTSTTDNGTLELILTGANTFSSAATGGVMTVNRGYVRLGSAGALGNTPTIFANNTWGAASTVGVRLVNGITIGAGRTLILRNGPGAGSDQRSALDNVSGNNTWAGNIILESPVSTIRNQTVTSASGTLTINGNIYNSSILPSAGLFVRGVGNGVINGNFLLGSGMFLKTDGGNWIINSTGNTQGSTTLAVGSITLNNTSALEAGKSLILGQNDGSSTTLTINGGFSQNFSVIDNATGSNGAHTITGAGSLDTGASGIPITLLDGTSADDLTITANVTGAGGFSKAGAGTLNLNGTTISGPVSLTAGTTRGNATFNGGLSVGTGTTLVPGSTTAVGSLTASTLAFSGTNDLPVNIGSAGSDAISVTTPGGLTQSGTTTITVTPNGTINTASTFYPIISYTGTSPGTSGFVLGTLPGRVAGSITDNGSAIGLTATNDKVKWTGLTDATWDINTTQNWQTVAGATNTNYLQGDDLIFTDTGTNTSITLGVAVSPAAVDFQNTSGGPAYSLAGAGSLTGSMTFTKSGTGLVTLGGTAAHTYTGATSITAGTLAINAATNNLTGTSGVSVDSGSTLRLFSANADFTFNRNISGSGIVEIDANASGTAGSRGVTLSGTSAAFTGTLNLVASGTLAANGSSRTSAAQAALGTANVVVNDRAQFWPSGTVANNVTITGYGYQEAAGGTAATAATAADGTTPTLPSGTYTGGNSGIGAIRMDNATMNGSITLNGDSKIMAYNTTGTITGTITNTASTDDLVVGGGGAGTNLVLTGDNSGLERIWVNGGGTAGTNTLIIGNNTTTGTLGSDDVILYNDAAGAGVRFQRTDGYTLGAGQDIMAARDATASNLSRSFVHVNATGTGLNIGSNTIDLSDGTNAGSINIGTNISGASLTMGSGSVVQAGNLWLGEQTGNSSTVNQNGGAVSIINQIRVGHWGTETSIYNISAGNLDITGASPATTPSSTGELNGGIYLGIDGRGIFNQSGGTVTTNWVVLDNRGDTGVGTNMVSNLDQYNLSAGTLDIKSTWGVIQRNSGELNLSGGTVRVNNTGTGTGTGANLTIPLDTTINVTGTGSGLDTNGTGNKFTLSRNVNGSGTVTTSGGGDINLSTTTTQTVSAIIAGTNPVVKLGTGATTLSGANTYSGATTVSAGRLNLSGSAANSAMSLANTTSLGGEGTVASLTLGAAGTDITNLYVDGATAGALTSTGTLTVNGPASAAVNVNLTSVSSTPGTITVLNHGGTAATAAQFALVNSASYRGGTFTVTGSAVTLDILNKNLVWDGTTTSWEIGGSENDWNDTANDNFFNGDNVTFNDTFVAADQTVTMVGALQPSAVTVNNNTYNYTLTGSGIGGSAGITKSGGMNLSLGGDNTFSGGLTINDGMVNIGAAGAGLGATGGQITVNTGGQFNFKGFSPIAGRTYSFTIAGDGADGFGDGAITNDTASVANNSRVQNLTLTDDATIGTFGGTLPDGNRLDVASGGTITGNGFTLTKVGDAMLNVRGPATDISYLVSAGTLRAEDSDLAFGSTGVQVNTNATLDSYGNRTFAVPVTFQSGSFLTCSNSTANWTGLLTLQGDVTIGGSANVNITQPIAETATGLFTKSGTGTTILPAGNTFNRKFVVDAGILRIPTNDALGVTPGSPLADSITLQNGGRIQAGNATAGVDLTLDSNRGITLPSGNGGFHVWTGFTLNYAGAVVGSGNFTKTDGGTLNFTGTASHTGGTTFSVGTTNLNGATIPATSGFNVSGGTTNLNSGSAVTTTGSTTIGTATLNIAGGALSTGRLIVDEGSNTSSTINHSSGTVTVTGTNSSNDNTASFLYGHYGSGNTATYNLSGGTLNSAGAELSFGWDSTNSLFNQSGGIANLLGIDLGNGRNNMAVYNLTGGRLNIGANGITTNGAKVVNLGSGTLGAFADWSSGQAMSLAGIATPVTIDTLDSVDSLTPRTITLTGVLSGSGGLAKANSGALLLGAANTYSGPTTVNGGTLRIQGTGKIQSTSSVTVNAGATLQTAATNFFVLDHGTAVPASRLITVNGGTWVMESGDYRLGNVTLSNGATWTSDTTTDWGVLLANTSAGAATVTVSGTAASVMNGTGSLRLQGVQNFDVADVTSSSAADLTVSMVLNTQGNSAGAAGGVNKTGAGTMVLGGVNTYFGNTTVNAGTLQLADDARLTFVIGATSGTNNSISGSGTAVLDGDFAIDTTAAAALTTGSWTLESVTSLTGAYGSTFRVVNTDGSPWSVSGDTWTKTVGSKIWTFVENTGVLSVAESGYASWAALHAGGGIASADYDGDGVANGLEWVLGGNETTNDLGKLPAVSNSGGNLVFTFYRDQDSITPDTTVTIEVGTTLTGWPSVYAVPATGGTSGSPGTVTVTKDNPAAGTDKVELSVAQSPDTKKFARLKVTTTP